MDHFVHGLFRDEVSAARAVQALQDAHFNAETISALMTVRHHVEQSEPVYQTPVGQGAALGGALGVIGASVLVLGGVLVAGPAVALLAGGAAGMLAGGFGGLGQWREAIDFSDHEEGSMILVGVSTEVTQVDRARAALALAVPRRVHVCSLEDAIRYVAWTEDRPGQPS